MCLCLFVITKFYLIIPNFHTDMPFKRDRLVNFYILLEKCEKNRYICNSITQLHKIRRDDAERVSQVHGPLKRLISKIQNGGRPIRSRNAFCINTIYRDLRFSRWRLSKTSGV